MFQPMKAYSLRLFATLQLTLFSVLGQESPAPAHDGSHDFDFLIYGFDRSEASMIKITERIAKSLSSHTHDEEA
jgi:hypothetical protein